MSQKYATNVSYFRCQLGEALVIPLRNTLLSSSPSRKKSGAHLIGCVLGAADRVAVWDVDWGRLKEPRVS